VAEGQSVASTGSSAVAMEASCHADLDIADAVGATGFAVEVGIGGSRSSVLGLVDVAIADSTLSATSRLGLGTARVTTDECIGVVVGRTAS
jgi:hypothetical protein